MTKPSLLALSGLLFALNGHAVTFDQIAARAEQIRTDAAQIDAANCTAQLETLGAYFDNWVPVAKDTAAIRRQGNQALASLFKARMALHDRLGGLPQNCVAAMRTVFRNMRLSEDMIGVVLYQDKQIPSESLKFDQQPVPLLEPTRYRPFQVNGPTVSFQKGDIMITKGVSVISSTISALPVQPSVYSHIVFVYQDEKSAEFGTIESYIGKGVGLYAMRPALQNENARILLLRPKDQAVAQAGHDYMLKRVRTLAAEGKHIPYDYEQDFSHNDALSCEEVAYDAYKTASNGALVIPWNESVINVKAPQFLKSAGVHQGPMMVPGDMEVDPRFDIVLDWTDYRLVRDSWRKDAVLREIVRWMDEKQYVMHDTFKATMGSLLWKTRDRPLLWPMFSRITGIPKDFETQVPSDGVALIANLSTVGEFLVPKLAAADEDQFKRTGQWMSPRELQQTLEQIRVADQTGYERNGGSGFHFFFRPGP